MPRQQKPHENAPRTPLATGSQGKSQPHKRRAQRAGQGSPPDLVAGEEKARENKSCEEEARLAHLLATPGAFGRQDGARMVVFAPQRGVSLRIGAVPVAAARRLESAGAIVGTQRGDTWTYRVTDAGQARVRRQKAGPDNSFGEQHRMLLEAPSPDGQGGRVMLNEAESPLLRLRRRKGRGGAEIIGDAEFAAGERLRADLTMSRMMPRLTADWERGPSGSGGGLNPTEMMMTARQRADRALAAVGPEFSGLLVDVCGFLKSIETVERERGWPVRSAKVVLGLGLARLARHYGLSNVAIGVARGGQRHVWGAEDARPEFRVDPPQRAATSA